MLRFRDLQEALRELLWNRIDSGELTGKSLAKEIGFQQSHISYFLNRKRGLSLDAMDRILRAEDLSVLDLVPPDEISQRATIPPPREDEYANVLLVGPQHAAMPLVHARDVLEVVRFKQQFLRRMRPDPAADRSNWLRFVMLRPSRACCEAMAPRLTHNAHVLIDRHYNSLNPYRRGEHTMYAVLNGDTTVIRYVQSSEDRLALFPENRREGIKLLHVPQDMRPEELIVGRVAFVSMEL
jgi:hypothetical protein